MGVPPLSVSAAVNGCIIMKSGSEILYSHKLN